jgi:hypothetical protein
VLRACQRVGASREPSTDPLWLALLGLVTLEEVHRLLEQGEDPGGDEQKVATRMTRRLELIEQGLGLGGRHVSDVASDLETFDRHHDLAVRFEAAVGPIDLPKLLEGDAEPLRMRLAAFLERADLDDEEFALHVGKVLESVPGLSPAQADDLIGWLGLARARTHSDEHLKTVGHYYAEWSRYLRRNGQADEAARETPLAALVQRLRARLGHRIGSQLAEELLSDVLDKELSLAEDCDRGYRYEGDFEGWLVQGVYYERRNWFRRTARSPFVPLPPDVELAGCDDVPLRQNLEIVSRWQERFALVLPTFRSPGLPRAVWGVMLEDGDASGDRELAERISRELGVHITTIQLAGTRRRLRQRLYVFLVLDRLSPVQLQHFSDLELLGQVALRYGLARQDITTLCQLAALYRATRCEETLAGGLAALAVTGISDESRRGSALWAARDLLRWQGGFSSRSADARLTCCRAWIDEKSKRKLLSRARGVARQVNRQFALPALWFLVVLRRVDVDEILRVLCLAEADRGWVEPIAAILSQE